MSALTKMLIVLQLVFSVAVSVLLVLMISRQENYKSMAASEASRAVGLTATLVAEQKAAADARGQIALAETGKSTAEQALAKDRDAAITRENQLQAQILNLQSEKNSLQNQNQALTLANATALSSIDVKDKELADLRGRVAPLNTRNAELERRNNELESQNRLNELAIRKLQEQLVASAPAAGASIGGNGQVQALSSGASFSGAVNAKIEKVLDSSGRILISMPLGSRDGITQNTPMFIYRSTGYVGDAIVERVTATESVAVVTKTKEGTTVQPGDTISTIAR